MLPGVQVVDPFEALKERVVLIHPRRRLGARRLRAYRPRLSRALRPETARAVRVEAAQREVPMARLVGEALIAVVRGIVALPEDFDPPAGPRRTLTLDVEPRLKFQVEMFARDV